MMQAIRLTPHLSHLIRRGMSSLPEHGKIIMPKVSPTMTEGRLISWKKREGDSIAEGEDLADIESDKATMPISARDDGFMARIFVDNDSAGIPLGQLLALTVEEQEHIAAFKDYQPPDNTPDNSISRKPTTPDPASSKPASPNPSPPSKYEGPIGPAVLRLLATYPNLNLNAITSTGPKGRILKGDILAAIESGHAFENVESLRLSAATSKHTSDKYVETQPISSTSESTDRPTFTDVPVSPMRRAIANRLLSSKSTIPHQYTTTQYVLDALLSFRNTFNIQKPSVEISVNDFIIKAISLALQRVPEMNSHWDEATARPVPFDGLHISMALAIQGRPITLIVPNADKLGLLDIAKVTKELIVKAKEGTLKPEECERGSFSISNLGMSDISGCSAIINPPQSSILAVGAPCKFPFPLCFCVLHALLIRPLTF